MVNADAARLLREGFVGQPDSVVEIRELIGDPNSGPGGRAFHLALADGLSFEVLPERGLDIGSAWYAGRPLAWRAPLGSSGPTTAALGWVGRWGGGLLLTCGLDNIGAPRGPYGQHGSHHDTRAHDVAIERIPATGGRGPGVRIRGTVDSVETFGRNIRLYRELTSYADVPALSVRDRIVNEGWEPAPVAVMYHVNFGAPLVLPGTRIDVAAGRRMVREEVPAIPSEWHTYPDPIEARTEKVWEHSELAADAQGRARATVTSPTGLTAEVGWDSTALPRLLEWVFPARGAWALGIEPSNAPIFGPEREAAGAGMSVLEPGAEIVCGVELSFRG